MHVSPRRLAALVLLSCAPAVAEIRTLTILHTNDLHAHIAPLENGRGGFAYLAAAIRRERAHCGDCILLNAGDLVQGTPVSTIFHGLPIYQLANLLGFDAASLGNHEFDYGWMQVRKFISAANYPIIDANLTNSKGESMTPKPYVILKVNGLRVAVLGGMTETLPTLTTPAALQDWRATPLIPALRQYAAELRDQSDLIVLVAHITGREEAEVLESVPEIAVEVTGHIHSGMTEALTRNGRLCVRVKGYGEEFGRLELKVDTDKKSVASWNWKRIPVEDAKLEPDPEIAGQVKHWEDQVTAIVDRPLAISKRAFTKNEVKRLIEHALRDETGSDFALMNIGGVRATLPEGQLLERNVWNIMPFDNRVVVGTFKGSELPAVVVGDRKVDPGREYTLAVSDYTAANQGTSENLQTTGLSFPHDVGLMRDLLIDWFRKKQVIE